MILNKLFRPFEVNLSDFENKDKQVIKEINTLF